MPESPLDPVPGAPGHASVTGASSETPDPHTVIFKLSQPRVAFLAENVAEWRAIIASPATVEKQGKEYGQHPVGTGPWKLVDWTPDDRDTLERNADSWGGPPLMDKLVVSTIPDTQTRSLEVALRQCLTH